VCADNAKPVQLAVDFSDATASVDVQKLKEELRTAAQVEAVDAPHPPATALGHSGVPPRPTWRAGLALRSCIVGNPPWLKVEAGALRR